MSTSLKVATSAEEYDICGNIWLEASKTGHPFIPVTFWEEHLAEMKERYLPSSHVAMVEEDGVPVGFVAISEDNLAALFILPSHWGRGIGGELLNHAREGKRSLTLSVYAQNASAIRFYKKHGFTSSRLQPCPHTGEPEIFMEWRAPKE